MKTGQKRPFVYFLQSVQLFQHFYYFSNPPPPEKKIVADDKENDLMVQLDSRPAGTVSARATPRTTPRTAP